MPRLTFLAMVTSVPERTRTVVLASGSGSNFQAMIDRFCGPNAATDIVGLVASRSSAGALERAARADIPCAVMPGSAKRSVAAR